MLAAEQDTEAATQQEPQMLAAEQDTVAATPTEPEKLQVQPEQPQQQQQVGDELLVPGGADIDIDGDDPFCSIGDAAFAAMSASFTSAALQGLQRLQEVSAVEEAHLQLPQEVGAVEGAGDHAAVRIDESQPASQTEVVLSQDKQNY